MLEILIAVTIWTLACAGRAQRSKEFPTYLTGCTGLQEGDYVEFTSGTNLPEGLKRVCKVVAERTEFSFRIRELYFYEKIWMWFERRFG